MSQSSGGCGCNDYSLLTANTGVAFIYVADPSLDGTGATTVITAGANGTIIKSVIIKAIYPVTTGMIRLFVSNADGSLISLYKEIPIPTTPALNATPTPLPMFQMFETCLTGDLKLQRGYLLIASTQNSEDFNIIAEGLDWAYPGTLPATCCNFKQETGVTGLGTVSVANQETDGSGTIVSIFTAPSSNGSVIKNITIKALQNTNEGTIRLFINDRIKYSLMKEIYIPQTTQSGFDPSFKIVLEENFHLQTGYSIGASTQIGQSFAITIEGTSWTYPIS